MSANTGKTSIRWRMVSTYFVIVFIAMTISGVFILSQLEAYNYNLIETNSTKTAQSILLSVPFKSYSELKNNSEEIRAIIEEWRTGAEYEVFVIDKDLMIVASDNETVINKSALGILDNTIIVSGLQGENAKANGSIQNGDIPVMNIGFPIENSMGQIIGVLYMRSDLTGVHKTINRSKVVFLEAMVLALIITFVISLLLAGSITGPINDVTEQAEKMAGGDFSRKIDVKSTDEIGRLAQMFNLLCEQLDDNISQISNEKNKLETILNNMTDGLIVVETTGYIIHANPAARKMLRLSSIEITERTHFDKVAGKIGKELKYKEIETNLKNGIRSDIIYVGSTIFAVGFADFKDDIRNDVGIIMLFRDITEAQKIERMQTEFVANVSHELKTPITTIKSYTETLLDANIDDIETVRSFLSIINNETDRMGRLVKELLMLSRLDYKQEKLKLIETDLTVFLADVLPKVKLSALAKKQHLNSLFDDKYPQVAIIDRDRMEQVVLNVMSNAIKYTQEGGRIDIDLITRNGMINIIITDNGIGMNDEEVSRIFERFYRVDKARSRAEGGTGLGLSIAKQIVESHKGKIEVESHAGRGTAVTIRLPLSWSRGIKNID